jgi:hypothetical protein
MYYISDIASSQRKIGRELMAEDFIKQVEIGLLEKQRLLENRFDWQGAIWPNGLWGEVLSINRVIFEFDGIVVLHRPEDPSQPL